MTAQIRSMLIPAFLDLPFHSLQRSPPASSTITAFSAARSGLSDDKLPAIRVRCCSHMARWNQSRIGGPSTPASKRMRRSPEQPSVNAEHRRLDASNSVEIAADQRGEVRVGLGNRTEYLPTS